MGSSVNLCSVLGLWITFQHEKRTPTTPPRKLTFFGDKLSIYLRCYQCRQLLQMILVEIKTAGYQT